MTTTGNGRNIGAGMDNYFVTFGTTLELINHFYKEPTWIIGGK
jgi:hypothetical protein